jgi:ribonuclease HIII
MTAQTSDRVSSIAARYIDVTPLQLMSLTATEKLRERTAAEVRSMAASVLRQDETKGLRKLIRKVTGR